MSNKLLTAFKAFLLVATVGILGLTTVLATVRHRRISKQGDRVLPTATAQFDRSDQPTSTDTRLQFAAAFQSDQHREGNWSEYNNKTFGYMIRYPAPSRLNTGREGADHVDIIVPLSAAARNAVGDYAFSIIVRPNEEAADAKAFAYKQMRLHDAGTAGILAESTTTVDGVPGYKIKQFSFDSNRYRIFVVRSANVYEISYVDSTSILDLDSKFSRDRYSDIFEAILKTFKWK